MGYARAPSPMRRWSTRQQACVYIAVTVVAFFMIFVVMPLPTKYDLRPELVEQVSDIAKAHLPDSINPLPKFQPPSLETTKSKYAYATYLAPNPGADHENDLSDDKYFVAARLLTYQLLHAPETKTDGIPLIILVTEGVSEAKRDRLRKDGAIVWEREIIGSSWDQPIVPGWSTVLTKLHLWELTQFERICFLDGDTVLAKRIDDVFDDPATHTQITGTREEAIRPEEGSQPEEYVFAAIPEMSPVHEYPPTEENHGWPNINYLNAGFFVLEPRLDMLSHYLSLLEMPPRFDPGLPEQNLFNYVHRRNGNMPWKALDTKWNMHFVSKDDLDGGVHSLHAKFWKPSDDRLIPFLQSWRGRMEGFHEARDQFLFRNDES